MRLCLLGPAIPRRAFIICNFIHSIATYSYLDKSTRTELLVQEQKTVIIGAGIAGIATAYYLSVKYGRQNILLVDRDQPLSYTTAKSGENYRDYWPQPCMASLARRSIELMKDLADESDNIFEMNTNGYDFVSFVKDREIFPSAHLRDPARAGELNRTTEQKEIGLRFPYLSDSVEQIVQVVQAGGLDVQAFGNLMLSKARKAGVRILRCHIDHLSYASGKYLLKSRENEDIEADELVLAAGPMNNRLTAELDVNLNIQSFLQRKFLIPDPLNVIPVDMPYTIFADPQFLEWTDEEKNLMTDDDEYRHLLDEFPPGVHIKPMPGGKIKLGWAFNRQCVKPQWQVSDDFDFPNITLRGASRFIPGLKDYVDELPTPVIQISGYYSRTPENWPIVGPVSGHPGLYTVAALSGFGTMVACATGELISQWMLGKSLPDYAGHFHPDRYQNPNILAEIENIESDGQL